MHSNRRLMLAITEATPACLGSKRSSCDQGASLTLSSGLQLPSTYTCRLTSSLASSTPRSSASCCPMRSARPALPRCRGCGVPWVVRGVPHMHQKSGAALRTRRKEQRAAPHRQAPRAVSYNDATATL